MLYQELSSLMAVTGADVSVAEAHGLAAGILCVNHRANATFWLQELSPDSVSMPADANDALTQWFEETRRLLIEEDMAFSLMLPDDDKPLSARLTALTEWCHGFLFGMGTANLPANLPDDSREIVKDIMEFTKLDTDASGEEAENDFMELTEYLRTSVMYLRIDLTTNNNGTVH
ncbi:MAG: UPF0149 family protein [Gammaproteobacteria bacterium]|nr:UPF0149 family protein [Gammaproteobacteria bacterium]